MKITIVAFSKLKSPGARQWADYYLKNLRPWVKIEEIELKPVPVSDKSEAQKKIVQEKEAEILVALLGHREIANSQVVLLSEEGAQLPTLKWAETLQLANDQSKALCFCLGGSLGFAPRLRKTFSRQISLGSQTLSHEIARLVLFEQIYRALSVNKRHPYHNS